MQEPAQECVFIHKPDYGLIIIICVKIKVNGVLLPLVFISAWNCSELYVQLLFWTFSTEPMLTTLPRHPNAQIREKILSSSCFFEASYTPSTFLLEGIMKELPQSPKINQINTNATRGLGFYFASSDMLFQDSEWSNEKWDLEKTVHFTSFPDKKNVWHACQC